MTINKEQAVSDAVETLQDELDFYDNNRAAGGLFDPDAVRTVLAAMKAAPHPLEQQQVALDAPMLGRFVMQYEDGAQGFFVDEDEAQEVALQVKAALGLGKAIMDEVHADPSIPTDAACKIYAAIKRAMDAKEKSDG